MKGVNLHALREEKTFALVLETYTNPKSFSSSSKKPKCPLDDVFSNLYPYPPLPSIKLQLEPLFIHSFLYDLIDLVLTLKLLNSAHT